MASKTLIMLGVFAILLVVSEMAAASAQKSGHLKPFRCSRVRKLCNLIDMVVAMAEMKVTTDEEDITEEDTTEVEDTREVEDITGEEDTTAVEDTTEEEVDDTREEEEATGDTEEEEATADTVQKLFRLSLATKSINILTTMDDFIYVYTQSCIHL
ncbi:hypothetical protein HID58_025149 [Brassica napus]|uniref:Uncharacterized protein n=1 Tax=Brassica napus TaxID=3708 RepID=A0ABQ8CKA1_BRANA|nr:hypothetical protein HID58_025149 [Brassica napus]